MPFYHSAVASVSFRNLTILTLKHTSHWKGFTLECICVCCLSPDDVANVFPHSGHAWDRAPTWWVLMCLWRLLGSVKIWNPTIRPRSTLTTASPLGSSRNGTSCARRGSPPGALWGKGDASRPWGKGRTGTHPCGSCAWRWDGRLIWKTDWWMKWHVKWPTRIWTSDGFFLFDCRRCHCCDYGEETREEAAVMDHQ